MKRNVVSTLASASIAEAATLFVRFRIGTLPIIDSTGHLVGILQQRDLLSLILPDFVKMLEDFDFIDDFGPLEKRRPDIKTLSQPIQKIMKPSICVRENCGLLRAFSVLYQEGLLDLPVTDQNGILIGIASRVDIGCSLLGTWDHLSEE
jgi:CBS-domain-containing membrane protein